MMQDHEVKPDVQSEVGSFPERVDLRPALPPVRDQGKRNTCVAFAVTAAHEALTTNHTDDVEDLAEEVLHWGCKQVDGEYDPGTTLTSAAEALQTWGQPREELWPYDSVRDDGDESYVPPEGALHPSKCHRAHMRRIDGTIAALRERLALGRPVVLGLVLSRGFEKTSDGHIPIPYSLSDFTDAHAVVAVGYVDSTATRQGYLIIRNSWGPEWGDGGYGYLPYAYIENYHGQAWVLDE